MSVLGKMLTRNRVRTARKRLAEEPTARNYALLAQEYAVVGALDEVLKVTEEALACFPGDRELRRLADRAQELRREGRTRVLLSEIAEAPRAALWRELCDLYLESGKVSRAEDLAEEWYTASKDGEAQLYRARARTERFFADRRRDDGRRAFELLDAAEELLEGDDRPLRLRLQLASRCGAWVEARRVIARLLELCPGEPALEARFRTVTSLSCKPKTIDQALREVELSGALSDDDEPSDTDTPSTGEIRPALKAIAAEPGVRAAVYARGATALVQGPKGATAERTARSIREIVQSSRTAARRLGLGQAFEVRIEGDFGELLVAPGDLAAGAIWCDRVSRKHEEAVRDLAGLHGRDGGNAQ